MNGTGGASQEADPAESAAAGTAAGPAGEGALSRRRRVRRLSAEEIAAYDLVPAGIAHRAVIVRVPVLLPGALGLTSGRFVLLVRDEPDDGTSVLIAHELVHVRQFAEQGRLRFAIRYVAAYLVNLARYRRHRTAYMRIPAEQEAFRLSREWGARRSGRR